MLDENKTLLIPEGKSIAAQQMIDTNQLNHQERHLNASIIRYLKYDIHSS